MTKIAIAGATGRMGRALIEAVLGNDHATLVAAITSPKNPAVGSDAGQLISAGLLNVILSDQLERDIDKFDVLIDFTPPENLLANLDVCVKHGKKVVIGTTGFTSEQKQTMQRCAQSTPVCFSANFSTGVNVAIKVLETVAEILGDDVDVEIVEAHHRHKVDSPSGTALAMGEAVAKSLGRDLKDCAIYGREGISEPRDRATIGFATVRAGDIVGEHNVIFAGDGERLEIGHKASSRLAFAKGAVRAAVWLNDQPSGSLYGMNDVLGL